jgi:hypothetical protein
MITDTDVSGLSQPGTQTQPDPLVSQSASGLSGLSQPGAQAGTSAPTPTQAAGGMVNTAGPHGRLLAMVQSLAVGVDSFAKAVATHGREGGVGEVQDYFAKQQAEKLQQEQATQQAAKSQQEMQESDLRMRAITAQMMIQQGDYQINLQRASDEHKTAQLALNNATTKGFMEDTSDAAASGYDIVHSPEQAAEWDRVKGKWAQLREDTVVVKVPAGATTQQTMDGVMTAVKNQGKDPTDYVYMPSYTDGKHGTGLTVNAIPAEPMQWIPATPQQIANDIAEAANLFDRAHALKLDDDPAIKQAQGLYQTIQANISDGGKPSAFALQQLMLNVKGPASKRVVGKEGDLAEMKSMSEAASAARPKSVEDALAAYTQAQQASTANPTAQSVQAVKDASQTYEAMRKEKLQEVATQATAEARARGTDYEAMIRTGVNPITKERLSLDNAPDMALVSPKGQVVPTNMISMYKPTPQEKQTADTARQVLAISADLKQMVAVHPDIIGPLMGRDSKAMSALGLSGAETQRALNNISLLQSAATKMHTGRFSNAILDKMGSMIGAQMNPGQFVGGLQAIDDVAERYAKEDQLVTVSDLKAMQQGTNGPSQASPQSHMFSVSAWQKANPRGDANAAKAAAQQQGFQVTQ